MFKRTAIVALALVLAAGVFAPQAAAQQKYAVLISAGQTTLDDQMINSEYWYDLLTVYRMLVARGFTHDHIFVLYGNGTDFASAHPAYQTATYFPAVANITDFAASKTNVQNIFAWLAAGDAAHSVPQIQPGDFLFYWWMGHGGWPGDDPSGKHRYEALIATTGETITDTELAAAFAQIPSCVVKNINVMTCHSGALLDDIDTVHIAAHASSRYDQNSFSGNYDVVHADFSYHIASAFWQQTPDGVAVASDTDGDGRLTVREANTYAHAHVASSETVVGDYRGIAPRVALQDAQPASGVPLLYAYSRDHAEDDGSVPSNAGGAVWYEGPDLWVRWLDDGSTTPQNPEFGQANYVYARVHNIGCAPMDVTAALSWCEQTAWASPASWNPIGSVTLTNLAPGESRPISTAWDTVPIPGKYCLHTVIDAAGDPANADYHAFMDNNKVQLNVTVEDTVAGWTKGYQWFIENGLEKKAVVDVVIKDLGRRTAVRTTMARVKLPLPITFEAIRGGTFTRTAAGTTIDIPAGGTVVIAKVPLAPLEKHEATLSVTLPAKLALGRSVSIKVAEQLDGREMGGIVFQTRSAEVARVMAQAARRTGNLLNAVSKSVRAENAAELASFFHETREADLKEAEARRALMRNVAERAPALRADWGRLLADGDPAAVTSAVNRIVRASQSGDVKAFVAAQDALVTAFRPHFRKTFKTRNGGTPSAGPGEK